MTSTSSHSCGRPHMRHEGAWLRGDGRQEVKCFVSTLTNQSCSFQVGTSWTPMADPRSAEV